MTVHTPTTPDDLVQIFRDAATQSCKLELRGGGSKASLGAPRTAEIVDMRSFAGVIDYDPAELVLTVGAGTSLTEVEQLVRESGQWLAFEPYDHNLILGGMSGQTTIGGIIASGTSGSGRVTAGGARDYLLGFTAVSGRGERFVAGAKVVKNVTGYDLSKLVSGSWGRLAALTELTIKVLPRPRVSRSMIIKGLDHRAAQAAMACAMGSNAEISAAAHLPAHHMRPATTMFRLQGFAPSVSARCAALPEILRTHGTATLIDDAEGDALWAEVTTLSPLADAEWLWRINVPPSAAPAIIDRFTPLGGRWLMDWAGGLLWLSLEASAESVRAAAIAGGGHAMLVRAPVDAWRSIPFQHPRAAGVARLEARVRRAFDPSGLFETGRFLDHQDAD